MYKLFLSLRYFRSRAINWIPVVCMVLGVTALLVILAVMDGFQDQLKATLRGSLSDLVITVNYDSRFSEWEKILLDMPDVKAVSPYLQSFALVADIPRDVRPGERPLPAPMDGALVHGIDPEREAEVSKFREYLLWRGPGQDRSKWRSSTPDPSHPFAVLNPRFADRPGVILGQELARNLAVSPPSLLSSNGGSPIYEYDRVFLTTMVRGSSNGSDESRYKARQREFCVTGIYESGNEEIDRHVAYMDRRVAKKFFELSRDPEEIRVALTNYALHGRVVRELKARENEIHDRTAVQPGPWLSPRLPPFFVQTWEDRRRAFLNAIENEKGLIAIIAGMAFVVTGFMIFSILSMVVTMKTRDIGILKSLGGTTLGVLKIFLLNGLLIGVIGSSVGLGLGLFIVKNINWIKDQVNHWFGWEPFPQSIYLFTKIPTRIIPEEAAAITLVALLVAVVGAILPALRASGVDPVESLRHE